MAFGDSQAEPDAFARRFAQALHYPLEHVVGESTEEGEALLRVKTPESGEDVIVTVDDDGNWVITESQPDGSLAVLVLGDGGAIVWTGRVRRSDPDAN